MCFVGLDAVGELDALDDLGQFVVAVEAAPALTSGHDELEDHRQRRFVAETSLASNGTMRHPEMARFLGLTEDYFLLRAMRGAPAPDLALQGAPNPGTELRTPPPQLPRHRHRAQPGVC